MEILEKLSSEQESKLSEIKNKWITQALGGNDYFDVDRFNAGIIWAYTKAELESPVFKVYVDSPLGLQYAYHILKTLNLKELKNNAQVRAEVRDQVYAEVSAQVHDQVYAEVSAQVHDQVYAQVHDQVHDQVHAQVSAQVYDQVYAQVHDQVHAQVSAQVYAQVSDQVRDQVRDQVHDQVRDQVSAQVRDQVRDQVYDQVYDQYESTSWIGLGWDSGWNSFYDYFSNIGIKVTENWQEYKKFIDSGVWDTILFNNFAIGCRRPNKVLRNQENRMHCDDGPAIAWRDGFKLYYLNGVHFPEDLFKKVTSGKMPFEDILAIEDIDQRTQAMRFGDVEKFLKHTKAKKLDEYTKHKPDNAPVIYRLFMIPEGDVFTEDAYYMVYDDPSTGKLYMSGVEEAQTVPEAMAWKQSGGFWKCTPEQWKAMKPLVHES